MRSLTKGVKNLGIHTELLADAMPQVDRCGVVTNKYNARSFSISTLFLAATRRVQVV